MDRENGAATAQLPLFEALEAVGAGEVARGGASAARRVSYARVTRDPAVARSSAANQEHAEDLRGSLRAFVAGLDPERRAELRARLGLPPADAAERATPRLRRVG